MPDYAQFITANAPVVGTIEGSLRTLTYILPGRFPHSEIAAEAVFAAVSLMGVYHDMILKGKVSNPEGPSAFNKYTQFLHRTYGPRFKKAAFGLYLLQTFQVLAESISLTAGGEDVRKKAVGIIEMLKLLCRLYMFKKSERRMLLHSQIEERDYDINTGNIDTEQSSWVGRRSQKTVDAKCGNVNTNEDIQKLLTTRALINTNEKPPFLVSKLKPVAAIGEFLNVAKPLVYYLLFVKYGRESWKPYMTSLSMDIISLLCLVYQKGKSMKPLESGEVQRRLTLLGYYILRDPFYGRFVGQRLRGFCVGASKRPLISIGASILMEYIPLWERFYFMVNP